MLVWFRRILGKDPIVGRVIYPCPRCGCPAIADVRLRSSTTIRCHCGNYGRVNLKLLSEEEFATMQAETILKQARDDAST